MISAIQQHPDNRGQIRICVYTGDYNETKESLLSNVKVVLRSLSVHR